MIPDKITKEYLRGHPEVVFVFGDNLVRKGYGGAATLRDEPNTYGFITKKAPDQRDESYYRPQEYLLIYRFEMEKLKNMIRVCPDKTFIISKLGAGLANRYKIWEEVVYPNIQVDLKEYVGKNVVFLF